MRVTSTGGRTPFGLFGDTAYCTSPASIPTFRVADLTGDRRPDIVVTHHCTDTTVGDTNWLVYQNLCAP